MEQTADMTHMRMMILAARWRPATALALDRVTDRNVPFYREGSDGQDGGISRGLSSHCPDHAKGLAEEPRVGRPEGVRFPEGARVWVRGDQTRQGWRGRSWWSCACTGSWRSRCMCRRCRRSRWRRSQRRWRWQGWPCRDPGASARADPPNSTGWRSKNLQSPKSSTARWYTRRPWRWRHHMCRVTDAQMSYHFIQRFGCFIYLTENFDFVPFCGSFLALVLCEQSKKEIRRPHASIMWRDLRRPKQQPVAPRGYEQTIKLCCCI